MISKLYFWMIFNQYPRIEEDRGTGEQGGERAGRRNYLRAGSGNYLRAGSGNYLRAGSGSRNQKGTHLLFITVYHPGKFF